MLQTHQPDSPRSLQDVKVKAKLSTDSDHMNTFHSVYTTLDTHKDISEFSHAIPVRNSHIQESELPHVLSANLLREPVGSQADFVANQRAEFEKIKRMDVPISLKIQLLTGSVDGLLGHLNLLKLSNSAIKDRIIAHEKMTQYAHFLSTNGSNSATSYGDSKCGVENHVMELLLIHQNPGSPSESNAISKFIASSLQNKPKKEIASPVPQVDVDDKNYIQFLLDEVRKLEDTIVDFKSTRNRVAVTLDDRRDIIIQLTNYIGEQSILMEQKMGMIEHMKELYSKTNGNPTIVKGGRRFINQSNQASSLDLLAHTQQRPMAMSQSVANFNKFHVPDPNESFCDKGDLEVEPQTAVQVNGLRKQNTGFFGTISDRLKHLVG